MLALVALIPSGQGALWGAALSVLSARTEGWGQAGQAALRGAARVLVMVTRAPAGQAAEQAGAAEALVPSLTVVRTAL